MHKLKLLAGIRDLCSIYDDKDSFFAKVYEYADAQEVTKKYVNTLIELAFTYHQRMEVNITVMLFTQAMRFLKARLYNNKTVEKTIIDAQQKLVSYLIEFKGFDPTFAGYFQDAFAESNIEIIPELYNIFEQKEKVVPFDIQQVNDNPMAVLEGLSKTLVNGFEFFVCFLEHVSSVVNLEKEAFMLTSLLESKMQQVRDVVVLALLHPNASARALIAELLGEGQFHFEFNSIDLRRMITLRNWVLKSERPAIDLLIKNCRKEKVICAPMPTHEIIKLRATSFDGSGCQFISFITKSEDGKIHMGGFVLKENLGICEPWVSPDIPLKVAQKSFIKRKKDIQVYPTTLEYVQQVVSDFLYTNISNNKIVDFCFLAVVECLGLSSTPQQLNIKERTASYLLELGDESLLSGKKSRSIISKPGLLNNKEGLCALLFEEGEIVSKIVDEVLDTNDVDDVQSFELYY